MTSPARSARPVGALKITFFPRSIVGYVGYPEALLTRGLAHGLSELGHMVRIVEPRQNHAFARTLREVGSGASRQFFDDFPALQHHTFEPRAGAQLLEWVTRELALIDVAVAVAGLDEEQCRWLANVTRPGLRRVYQSYAPNDLTDADAQRLELRLYDRVLAPAQPAADLPWGRVPAALAPQDDAAGLRARLAPDVSRALVTPDEAAVAFLNAVYAT